MNSSITNSRPIAAARIYRRYLLRSALLTIGLLLLVQLYIRNSPMRVFGDEYPIWKHQFELAGTPGSAHDLVIIGDSRALAGCDPQLMRRGCANLSLAGGTPIEGYYLLKRYLKHHPRPRNILLSFSAGHLERTTIFWERTVKYRFLAASEYAEILATARQLHNVALGTRLPFAKFLAFQLPTVYSAELVESGLAGRQSTNTGIYQRLKRDSGHLLFGTGSAGPALFDECDSVAFAPSPLLTDYLDRLVSLADSPGSSVFWYTMPVNDSSLRKVAAAYRSGFAQHLRRRFCSGKVELLKELHALPDDCFGDPSHVNREGKRRVSADVEFLISRHASDESSVDHRLTQHSLRRSIP